MDNRRLVNDGRRLRLYDPSPGSNDGQEMAVCTGQQYSSATTTEQQDAAELVKRWNAYPELVKALRQAHEFIQSLMDATPDESTDLLTNYGEDEEQDLADALASIQEKP